MEPDGMVVLAGAISWKVRPWIEIEVLELEPDHMAKV